MDKEKYVYVLRTCDSKMRTFRGFKWPESGYVEADKWKPEHPFMYGLFGLLWGEGNGSLLDSEPDAKWIITKVLASDIVQLKEKTQVKYPKGEVVFVGEKQSATLKIIELGAKGRRVCYAKIEMGDMEMAAVGYGGTAISGYCGISSSGPEGISISGKYGESDTGFKGLSVSGDFGTSFAGQGGIVMSGVKGIIGICYYDPDNNRNRYKIGYIGEDGLKPNVKYRLSNDAFKEVE